MTELPQKIGPYRVLRRLGAGGMGEVFLAHDDRLDRRVAIKRIRPETGSSPQRRERLRREARLAARLSHPAIVRVYDILEDGDHDSIVLEYVEGMNLRELARQAPLEVGQVIALARALAGGLEAAHQEGIVHRDLKSENVLVTPAGWPKIADFGIAKQLTAADDEALTGVGAVVGTWRAMAPEQATGEPVDHRTDLFALGVLLYELLTGRTPFAAETPEAALGRLLYARQTPVRELNPDVPAELSLLIDHLLEKEPSLRPQNAGRVEGDLERMIRQGEGSAAGRRVEPGAPRLPPAEDDVSTLFESPMPRESTGAGSSTLSPLRARSWRVRGVLGLLALLAAGAGWYGLAARTRPPVSVGVLRPEVETSVGTGEHELLGSGVRVALLQALISLEGISPRAFDEVDAVSGTPVQVAKALAADELVTVHLDCRPEACRVSLERLRGADARALWAAAFEVPTDDFSLVADVVARRLREGYREHRLRGQAADLGASGPDFERFLALRRRFDLREEADLAPVLAELAAIRRRSPRLLEVYLLEAEIHRHRFWDNRDPRELREGLQRIAEARRLAPHDPRPLLRSIDLRIEEGDLAQARATTEELARLLPGDVAVLERNARILNAEGKQAEALVELRKVAQLSPSSRRLRNVAQTAYQQGHIDEARHYLERLLERTPGDVDGLSLLALIELSSGDPERAVRIYRDLVRRSPGLSQLSNLGLACSLLGRYAEAEDVFRRVTAREPNNPQFTLNLADALTLNGKPDEAQELYRRVVELVEKDPGASPQLLTVKAQALAHLGQGPRAVAALQEALRLAPGQGWAAYEAAVVYSLLGERDSALFNARRAIELGFGAHWFSFPWFEPLRRHPEIRELTGPEHRKL